MKIEINQIIPQSSPMLMIDELLISNDEKTICGLTIKPDNIFVHEEKLKEAGIIENMAQTAAARAGYTAHENNTPVKTGFIGSIKNLHIYKLPSINSSITTHLKPVSDIGNISVVKTEVQQNDEKIAECSMTIILMD